MDLLYYILLLFLDFEKIVAFLKDGPGGYIRAKINFNLIWRLHPPGLLVVRKKIFNCLLNPPGVLVDNLAWLNIHY
jgi:hypothetical protein